MADYQNTATQRSESALQTNKVLRNTYALLSMTLVFSAICAVVSMAMNLPYGASLIMSLGAIAIVWFVLPRTYDSSMGLVWTFVFTGLLGAGLGPILNHYLALPNGGAIVAQAMGGTAIVTFALSAYAVTTKKDFSFLGGFIMVGMIIALVAIVANLFFAIPALSLAISAGVVLLMSLFILYDTSRIVNGGETNYIRATVGLYLSIYNIFVHLLHLLGVMSND